MRKKCHGCRETIFQSVTCLMLLLQLFQVPRLTKLSVNYGLIFLFGMFECLYERVSLVVFPTSKADTHAIKHYISHMVTHKHLGRIYQ